MTNPEHQAGRLTGYIIEQTETLHAQFFQYADRRGMIGPHQTKHFR